MFKNLITVWREFKAQFLFGFYKAMARESRMDKYYSKINLICTDGILELPIFHAEKLATFLTGNGNIPSALLFLAPKHYTGTCRWAIYVNKAMLLTPMPEQLGVYMHEAGHLVHQHLINTKTVFLNDLIKEVEADMFAVSAGHQQGLKDALVRMRSFIPGTCLDLDYRIEKLRTNEEVA